MTRSKKHPPALRKAQSRRSSRLATCLPPPPPPPVVTAHSPLDVFPLEIIYILIDLLPTTSLVSFSLSSKQYQALVYPFLYKRLLSAELYWVPPRGNRQSVGALGWATVKGHARLAKRLMKDIVVTRNDHMERKPGRSLLELSLSSGDDETARLMLKSARDLDVPDEVVGAAMIRCKNYRVLSIVSAEASRRLKLRGFG